MAGNFNRRMRGGMVPRENKSQNMTGNRIEFRFLIPSRAASIIIGKGGERIQRLRHECNARLSIPDNHGPERVFILESTVENCIKIWRDCIHELKECMFPSNSDQRRGAANAFREDAPDTDLRFLVHDSQAGVIIGKAGVNVKNLRMQFQLNVIKVYPVTAPFSSDRVVQMVGKFDRIADCFRLIYESLEGQAIKGVEEKYNSANFDESLSSSYGGWGNQSNFDGGMANNQNSPNMPQNMRKQAPQMGGGAGGPAGGDRNQQQGGRFSTNKSNSEQFYPKSDMNNRPNMNASQKQMSRFDNFNSGNMSNNNENFAMDNFSSDLSGFEMESESFQMPAFINNRMPMSMPPGQGQGQGQGQDQGFSGMRKRMNADGEPDSMKRGRFGGPPVQSLGGLQVGNIPNTFDGRKDKQQPAQSHHFETWGGEKSNFIETNRNDKSSFEAKWNEKPGFEGKWNEKPGFEGKWNEKQTFENKWNEKPGFENKWNEKPGFEGKWNEKPGFEGKWNEKPGFENKWNEKPGLENKWNEKTVFENKWNEKPGFENKWNEKSGFDGDWNESPGSETNWNEKPGFNTNRNDTAKPPNFYDKQPSNMLSGGRPDNANMPPPTGMMMGNTNFGPLVDKVDVLVPSTLVHAIRGQNCVALSNIINDSGADVLINPTPINEDDPNTDTTITITGTKDQIEGAQYLLQICIKKSVLNL